MRILSKEKPVMVLKYSTLRLVLFVFLHLILILLILMIYGEVYGVIDKSLLLFFIIFEIWFTLDLLNTKHIEVYMDRIVRRVWINVPFLREKTFYFKEIYFMLNWSGLFIARKIGLFYTKGPRLFLHMILFKREDAIRLAEFFSRISGKSKDLFLYRPFYSLHYKLIENKNDEERLVYEHLLFFFLVHVILLLLLLLSFF